MDKSLKDKIKSILGMQPEIESNVEETVIENVSETVSETETANTEVTMQAETGTESTAETKSEVEIKAEDQPNTEIENNAPSMEEILSTVTDLVNRVANLEAQLGSTQSENTELKKQTEQIMELVNEIADQPSGSAPKRTDSIQLSKISSPENKEKRLKNMLNMLQK